MVRAIAEHGVWQTGVVVIRTALAVIVLLAGVACGQELTAPEPGAESTETTPAEPSPDPGPVGGTPTAEGTPLPAPSLFPLSITGSDGKEITLERPPERIVAIDGAAVEILFELGEGHRVVGTHDFVFYPPEAGDIPRLGGAFSLDFERMAELEPDLIYTFFDQFVPQMKQLGAPVLYLEAAATLEEAAEHMRTWGEIVGRAEAGESLAAEFEESVAEVAGHSASIEQGPRVYHDASPDWWTSGAGTLMEEILAVARAENIFADVSGFVQVSPEEIVARDPEVIISTYSDGPDAMRGEPVLEDVAAVRDDRILLLDPSLISVPGPRLVQAIQEIAEFLHPDVLP